MTFKHNGHYYKEISTADSFFNAMPAKAFERYRDSDAKIVSCTDGDYTWFNITDTGTAQGLWYDEPKNAEFIIQTWADTSAALDDAEAEWE